MKNSKKYLGIISVIAVIFLLTSSCSSVLAADPISLGTKEDTTSDLTSEKDSSDSTAASSDDSSGSSDDSSFGRVGFDDSGSFDSSSSDGFFGGISDSDLILTGGSGSNSGVTTVGLTGGSSNMGQTGMEGTQGSGSSGSGSESSSGGSENDNIGKLIYVDPLVPSLKGSGGSDDDMQTGTLTGPGDSDSLIYPQQPSIDTNWINVDDSKLLDILRTGHFFDVHKAKHKLSIISSVKVSLMDLSKADYLESPVHFAGLDFVDAAVIYLMLDGVEERLDEIVSNIRIFGWAATATTFSIAWLLSFPKIQNFVSQIMPYLGEIANAILEGFVTLFQMINWDTLKPIFEALCGNIFALLPGVINFIVDAVTVVFGKVHHVITGGISNYPLPPIIVKVKKDCLPEDYAYDFIPLKITTTSGLLSTEYDVKTTGVKIINGNVNPGGASSCQTEASIAASEQAAAQMAAQSATQSSSSPATTYDMGDYNQGYSDGYTAGSASSSSSSTTTNLPPEDEDENNYDAGTTEIPGEDTTEYTLTVNKVGSGSVSKSSQGPYDEGTVVTLTANPSQFYRFDHWSGVASGTSNIVTITMDSDKSVTAHFQRIKLYIDCPDEVKRLTNFDITIREENENGAVVPDAEVVFENNPIHKTTDSSGMVTFNAGITLGYKSITVTHNDYTGSSKEIEIVKILS